VKVGLLIFFFYSAYRYKLLQISNAMLPAIKFVPDLLHFVWLQKICLLNE